MAELAAVLLVLVLPTLLGAAVWKHWDALRRVSTPARPYRVPTPVGGSGRSGGGRAGQREPRRPRPSVGSGAAALPIPIRPDPAEQERAAARGSRVDRSWRSAG